MLCYKLVLKNIRYTIVSLYFVLVSKVLEANDLIKVIWPHNDILTDNARKTNNNILVSHFFVSSFYYRNPLVLKFSACKLIFIMDISNNALFFNLHNKRCVVYNIIFHLSKVHSDNQSCAPCFDQDFDQREEGHASGTANTHD